MSEQKPTRLNLATVWSIRQAGNRQKALEFLDLLSKYVDNSRERMRECLRDGKEFKGTTPEVAYFNYLLAAQQLIDELYPLETRS